MSLTLRKLLRAAIAHPAARRHANALYRRLSWPQIRFIQRHFAAMFRGYEGVAIEDTWPVEFAGREIKMPLRPEWIWLDWDSAVSICGHDIEIKRTYDALLRSPSRPAQFIDIGANYGTHSLIFLSHGIDTITFEPNETCHDHFQSMCRLNGLTPRIEGVALGDRPDQVTLTYPPRDTWLGSTNIVTQKTLASEGELIAQSVEQRTLDDYLEQISTAPVLIKVDTEGNEAAVLRGGRRVLEERHPLVIFETFKDDGQRAAIFETFTRCGYAITRLPWAPGMPEHGFDQAQFVAAPGHNFIAVPQR